MTKEQEKAAPPANVDAITQLVTQLLARQPVDPNHMGLTEAQRASVSTPPAPQKYRLIPGKNDETGATYDMHVVESKAHKNGRITRLENYKWPEGAHKFMAQGGLIPDGMPITFTGGVPADMRTADPADLLVSFKHWRSTEFWVADLRRLVGKEVKSHHCVDQERGLSTPWLESAAKDEAAE